VFSNLLPKSVARYYSISGKRGEVKKNRSRSSQRGLEVQNANFTRLVKQNSLVAKIKVSIFANTISF
jgi:hypothetical protein